MVTKSVYRKIILQLVEMAKFHHKLARGYRAVDYVDLTDAIDYHQMKRDAFMANAKSMKETWMA